MHANKSLKKDKKEFIDMENSLFTSYSKIYWIVDSRIDFHGICYENIFCQEKRRLNKRKCTIRGSMI